MRYLLDTNVVLWLFLRSHLVSKKTRALLANPQSTVYVSAAATWEIAIKSRLGKLELPGDPGQYLPDRIERAGLTVLPISTAHTYGVFSLPLHHRDPFDRLLIAQAQIEGMIVVTSDAVFSKYDVKRLKA